MIDPKRMLPTAATLPPSQLTPPPHAKLDASRAAHLGAAPETTAQEAFTDFVGQTLFGSMLSSMRKTVGTPAYMHGGRTEEVFQQQLDQLIVEDLTDASAESIAEPMYNLFNLQRRA